MKYQVLSRHAVQSRSVPDCPYIIISLRDVDSEAPWIEEPVSKIWSDKKCMGVLGLEFHDCEKAGETFLGRKLQPMSSKQAEELWRFYLSAKDKVDLTIVHCEAGISRSSATAAALAKASGYKDDMFFNNSSYNPNMLVYRLILKSRN